MSLPDPPASGRVYEATRRVRLADADPAGRLRFDALARLLQDVGTDDTTDAGLDAALPWVARRSEVDVVAWPRLGDRLHVATWCGGIGARWAERRSTVTTGDGGRVEVATLWVHVDRRGRPARLPERFLELYADAAAGREVSPRLALADPGPQARSRPWPVRATDLDVLGHVNNAVAWAPVEDECARRRLVPHHAVVEWRGPVGWDDEVRLASAELDGAVGVWLSTGDGVRIAARVS